MQALLSEAPVQMVHSQRQRIRGPLAVPAAGQGCPGSIPGVDPLSWPPAPPVLRRPAAGSCWAAARRPRCTPPASSSPSPQPTSPSLPRMATKATSRWGPSKLPLGQGRHGVDSGTGMVQYSASTDTSAPLRQTSGASGPGSKLRPGHTPPVPANQQCGWVPD